MDRNYMKSSGGVLGADNYGTDIVHELEQVRAENDELRTLVLELEQTLQQASTNGGGNGDWESQAREYEALIDEKTEVIRQLHGHVQELEEALANQEQQAPAKGPAPREDELMRLSEELERDRRQLQEDEESLMEQMRNMELQMARERAEMARQRSELQRLQNDLRHELEVAARDTSLRERLAPLQRKHSDIVARKGARG